MWRLSLSRYIYTIREEDVENQFGVGCNSWKLWQAIGKLLPCDVGKRVYDYGSHYQVENQRQMEDRLAKEA